MGAVACRAQLQVLRRWQVPLEALPPHRHDPRVLSSIQHQHRRCQPRQCDVKIEHWLWRQRNGRKNVQCKRLLRREQDARDGVFVDAVRVAVHQLEHAADGVGLPKRVPPVPADEALEARRHRHRAKAGRHQPPDALARLLQRGPE
eukprot:347947-Chlamydomonas_euryale.AAC.12